MANIGGSYFSGTACHKEKIKAVLNSMDPQLLPTVHNQRSPLMTFVFWPTLFPSWTPPCLSQPVNDLMFTGLQSRASAGLQTRAEDVHKNKPTPSLKLRSKSKRGAKKGRRRKSSKAIFDDYGE